MTVLGNVMYALNIKLKNKEKAKEESLKMLEMVNMKAHIKKYPHELSGGMRQRVMIAKALAQDTQIILLDEPTAFLDFAAKAELMQLLHRLAHEHNKTILLSTHDLELAFQTVDRLWLLAREGLVEGDARQLMDSGRLADFFAAQGLTNARGDLACPFDFYE